MENKVIIPKIASTPMYDVGAYPIAQYGGGKRPLFLQEQWYACTGSLMKGGGSIKNELRKMIYEKLASKTTATILWKQTEQRTWHLE